MNRGEQTVNLTGDVKGFELNVTVKEEKMFLSPLAYGIIGILVLIIVVLVFKNRFTRIKRIADFH